MTVKPRIGPALLSSSIVFVPAFVLVLVVNFSPFQSGIAELWIIVARGILNTSVEDS
jgi:hypothetical protein